MKGQLKVLDRTGHSVLTYDSETREGLAEARATIDEVQRAGGNVFDTSQPDTPVIEGFRPGEQSDLLAVPAFQGG